MRAVEELAGEGDHAVHEVGLDEGAADVALASQALRVSGPFTTCAARIAVTGLVGGRSELRMMNFECRIEDSETSKFGFLHSTFASAGHAVRGEVVDEGNVEC